MTIVQKNYFEVRRLAHGTKTICKQILKPNCQERCFAERKQTCTSAEDFQRAVGLFVQHVDAKLGLARIK